MVRRPLHHATASGFRVGIARLAVCAVLPALVPTIARSELSRLGVSGMLEPHTACLLVDYYDNFLKGQDIDAFRASVTARYTEGTLTRLAQSADPQARRAAVLALGIVGSFRVNDAVAKALRDSDPNVRGLAQSALWAIWFRAGTPEQNALLEEIHDLNGRRRFREAIELADRLIRQAPEFAEAYNQRAIAAFFQERFADSAADCRRVLELNPHHLGALSGLAQCYLKLGKQREALATFRRALKLQPYSTDLRDQVAILEAAGE